MRRLLLQLSIFVSLSQQLFNWEPRVLKCDQFSCLLLKTEQEGWKTADCRIADEKHICNLECDGADRDSVISKNPTDFRHCNRFFTYNTLKTPSAQWFLWRNGTCSTSNITLSVHCAFPVSGQ